MLRNELQVAQPGELQITEGVLDIDWLGNEIDLVLGLQTSGASPITFDIEQAFLENVIPRIAATVEALAEITAQRTNTPVSGYSAAFLLCGAGVWFPPHIDELPLRRFTLGLSQAVDIDEYTPGNHKPGAEIANPGLVQKSTRFPEGAVLSIDNRVQAIDRVPHGSRTAAAIESPRLALVATLY